MVKKFILKSRSFARSRDRRWNNGAPFDSVGIRFRRTSPSIEVGSRRCKALQHASIQTCNNFWVNSHSVEGKMRRERKKKKKKIQGFFPFAVVYDARIFNDTSRDISPLENVFTSGMTRTIVADSHIRRRRRRRRWRRRRRRRRRRLVSTRIIAVLTSWLSYRTISDRSVTRDDPSLQYYWFAWRISIPVSFFRPTINFANVSSVMLCPRTEMPAICKCISLSPSPVSRNELRVPRN